MVPMTFKKRSCLESIRRAHDLMVLRLYQNAASRQKVGRSCRGFQFSTPNDSTMIVPGGERTRERRTMRHATLNWCALYRPEL